MTEKDKLDQLRELTVKAIGDELPNLSRDELAELLAREADANDPRETLIKAISKRIEQIDAEADAPAEAPTTKAKWMEADYSGPLTIEQAEWRNANIKPVREVTTK